jgi:CBS domain-containing membrane protein
MRVLDVMTKNPITIEPREDLCAAIAAFERHDCRHLLVVDQGKLVGVLSDRDVLAATGWVTEGCDLRRVSDVMHRDVKAAEPETELVSAATQMMLDAIGCLPVLENGKVVGIVTETDFVAAYLKALETGWLTRDQDPFVATVMTKEPITLSPNDNMIEARAIVRNRHIRHLPVVENGKLFGVISDRDIRRAEGRHHVREAVLAHALKRKLVTASPEQRLSIVAVMMLDHKISCVPVVAGERLVGIITMSDLLDRCANTLWQSPSRIAGS